MSGEGGWIAVGPFSTQLVGLVGLRGRMKLEAKGIRFKGASALSVCKRYLGMKGSRAKVLAELNKRIAEMEKDPRLNIRAIGAEGSTEALDK